MQEVEMYGSIVEAYRGMSNYIEKGWIVHTCTMGCYYMPGSYGSKEKVLVVYEK